MCGHLDKPRPWAEQSLTVNRHVKNMNSFWSQFMTQTTNQDKKKNPLYTALHKKTPKSRVWYQCHRTAKEPAHVEAFPQMLSHQRSYNSLLSKQNRKPLRNPGGVSTVMMYNFIRSALEFSEEGGGKGMTLQQLQEIPLFQDLSILQHSAEASIVHLLLLSRILWLGFMDLGTAVMVVE